MRNVNRLVLVHNSGQFYSEMMKNKLTDNLALATLIKDQYEVQQTLTFLPNHYEFKVSKVEIKVG